jgi:ElaB/YqjD/DUF883 family membrane-anchored ribosome-binding protein
MIVDCGKQIAFTHPAIVDFFTKHSGNVSLQDGAEELLGAYCKTMTVAMNSYENAIDKEREQSAIVSYLRSMEKRVEDRISKHAADSKEILTRVERNVESIPVQMQGMLATMVTSLDNAVRGSMEKFNVATIAAQVSANVKEWMGADLAALKESGSEHKQNIEALRASMHNILKTSVTGPMSQRIAHLQEVVRTLPNEIVTVWSSSPADKAAKELLQSKISELRKRMDAAASFHNGELAAMRSSMQNVLTMCKDAAVQKHMPLVKNAMQEAIKHVERQTTTCIETVKASQLRLVHMEQQVMNGNASLLSLQDADKLVLQKLDDFSSKLIVNNVKASCNTGVKGKMGEQRLYDDLCDKLTAREGYEIEMVGGAAHQCDIAVKRLGFPEVRIESKAHGDATGEKVRAKEVARFQSDIMALGMHGIFVSLHSNIVGKGNVEIEQLPNGRFAIYLANNNYDTDQIVDMLRLLYKLDAYTISEQADGVRISNDTLGRVQLILTSLADKIKMTKTHLKESITLLNDVSMDMLERILLSRDDTQDCAHTCSHCNKQFSTARGLSMHVSKSHKESS